MGAPCTSLEENLVPISSSQSSTKLFHFSFSFFSSLLALLHFFPNDNEKVKKKKKRPSFSRNNKQLRNISDSSIAHRGASEGFENPSLSLSLFDSVDQLRSEDAPWQWLERARGSRTRSASTPPPPTPASTDLPAPPPRASPPSSPTTPPSSSTPCTSRYVLACPPASMDACSVFFPGGRGRDPMRFGGGFRRFGPPGRCVGRLRISSRSRSPDPMPCARARRVSAREIFRLELRSCRGFAGWCGMPLSIVRLGAPICDGLVLAWFGVRVDLCASV